MTAPLPVGTIIGNGFIIKSTKRNNGEVWVRCPVCKQASWKHLSNVKRVRSCGCARGSYQALRWRLWRHRETVRRAIEAFRTDSNYGIEIAEAASRIRERSRTE